MKRSDATKISTKVRSDVMARDKGRCIVCGTSYNLQCAHIFINRSHGGMGVVENLAMLCVSCHTKLDNGLKKYSEPISLIAKSYLKHKYPNLDELKLKYQKGVQHVPSSFRK